jgi:transposase-like protein
MLVNAKNGISSWEVHRAMGVTQKTAWFMLQRCRLALQDERNGGKLYGEVEIDESFIGGKARNMHKDVKARKIVDGSGTDGKEIVLGMVERDGRVRAIHVPKRSKPVLQKHIREHVEADAAIFTDELKSYDGLNEFRHEVINHAVAYVNGNVHTNTMENFWSLLKRGLHGTYVSVEPFHLFRYLDEQAFRYNNRQGMNDGERFTYAMRKVVGKRLTYAELTGKVGETEAF